MSAENASQHEANKMLRVLSGERLKYTVRVHKADGSVVEWQASKIPKIGFSNEARCLWIFQGGYADEPITQWEDGMILLTEENTQ